MQLSQQPTVDAVANRVMRFPRQECTLDVTLPFLFTCAKQHPYMLWPMRAQQANTVYSPTATHQVITTVTGYLQQVSLLAACSPHYVLVSDTPGTCFRVLEKWHTRYPELFATPRELTVLRKYGHPAPVVAVHSRGTQTSLLLLSNVVPEMKPWINEGFRDARVEGEQLTWHVYTLYRREDDGALTWRFSNDHKQHLMTSAQSTILHPHLKHEKAAAEIEKLYGVALASPLVHGVRQDIFDLVSEVDRLWKTQRPRELAPRRPHIAYRGSRVALGEMTFRDVISSTELPLGAL